MVLAARISEAEWRRHKSAIEDLYIKQRRTLSDLRRHMLTEYGFDATKSQYTTKLKQWGFVKNHSQAEWQAVDADLTRNGIDIRCAVVRDRGGILPAYRVDRSLARYRILTRKPELSPIPTSLQVVQKRSENFDEGSCQASLGRGPYATASRLKGRAKPVYRLPWNDYMKQSQLDFKIELARLESPSTGLRPELSIDEQSQVAGKLDKGQVESLIGHGESVRHSAMTKKWPYRHSWPSCGPAILSLVKQTPQTVRTLTEHISRLYFWTKRFAIQTPGSNSVTRLLCHITDANPEIAVRAFTAYMAFVVSNNVLQVVDSYGVAQDYTLQAMTPLALLREKKLGSQILQEVCQADNPTRSGLLVTLVHSAVEAGSNDLVLELLDRNLVSPECRTSGNGSKTLLGKAAESGNVEIARYLCNKGVCDRMETPDCAIKYRACVNHERSPLMLAARLDVPDEMLQILLKANAFCCSCDVLPRAIENGARGDTVALLLEAGASPIYSSHASPLSMAASRGDVLLTELLLASGANPDGLFFVNGFDALMQNQWDYQHNKRWFREAPHSYGIDQCCKTPLLSAVSQGEFNIAAVLLREHADPNICASDLYFGRRNPQMPDDLWFDDVPIHDRCYCPYPIQAAVARGDMDLITLLSSHGASLVPQWGSSLLSIAAFHNRPEVLLWLLHQGLDIDEEGHGIFGFSAIEAAILARDMNMVKILCQNGAKLNRSPCRNGGRDALQAAAESGDMAIFDFLLDLGADCHLNSAHVWGFSILEGLVVHGDYKRVNIILEYGVQGGRQAGCRNSPLCAAVLNEDFRMVSTLVEAGVDVNERVESALRLPTLDWPHAEFISRVESIAPIHLAASSCSPVMLEMLADGGADVNSISEPSGMTPLLVAILNRNLPATEYLVHKGAEVNPVGASLRGRWLSYDRRLSYDDVSPLMCAIGDGQFEAVELLLSKGALPNTESHSGSGWKLPLEEACSSKNVEMVELLLKVGANAKFGNPVMALLRGTHFDYRGSSNPEVWMRILDLLIESEAELDLQHSGYGSPLAEAAGISLSLVRRLVNAGASITSALGGHRPDVLVSSVYSPEAFETCQYLLSYDNGTEAWLQATSEALSEAAGSGLLPVASLLLEHGAQITVRAVERAVNWGRLDMTKLLLDNYAGPLTVTRVCQLAAKVAREHQEWVILELLEKYKPPVSVSLEDLSKRDLIPNSTPREELGPPGTRTLLSHGLITPTPVQAPWGSAASSPAASPTSMQPGLKGDVCLTLPQDDPMDVVSEYGL